MVKKRDYSVVIVLAIFALVFFSGFFNTANPITGFAVAPTLIGAVDPENIYYLYHDSEDFTGVCGLCSASEACVGQTSNPDSLCQRFPSSSRDSCVAFELCNKKEPKEGLNCFCKGSGSYNLKVI